MLRGGKGDDQLFGDEGNDLLEGGKGSDRLDGGLGDDDATGGEGDDRFIASLGFDQFDGGEGKDTADYGNWQNGVVLKYSVSFSLEQVPDDASENSVLATKTALVPQVQLEVQKGLRLQPSTPAPGVAPETTSQTPEASVTEPSIVDADGTGTDSTGTDGTGAATGTDVSNTDSNGQEPSESLLALPVSDFLTSVETIIAPPEQRNRLDFSFRRVASPFDPTPAAKAPAIDVDLSKNRLAFDDEVLTIQNFSEVLGSFGDDRIVGDAADNWLDGGKGKNQLLGGDGDDLLLTAEKDSLTGGAGTDRFQFRAVWASYSGRSRFTPRRLRPSRLEDFESGVDQILLSQEFEAGIVLSETRTLQYVPFYSLTAGTIAPEQWLVLGQGEVTDKTRFIYNDQTGVLSYRGPEIYAGLGEQLPIATLVGAPALQPSDLIVV